MTLIRRADVVQSVADALQFISYYHPADYIRALGRPYEREQSPAAKDAIAQILTNSRLCAEGRRPICQDTGIVCAFVKVGMDVRWEGATMSVAVATTGATSLPVSVRMSSRARTLEGSLMATTTLASSNPTGSAL